MKTEQAQLRFKPMDVVFGDNLWKPRHLILEVDAVSHHATYTTCGESGGVDYRSESSLRTKDEWLKWVDRFSDDLTGKQLREAKEAASAEFVEPDYWTAFRERYAKTGIPWIAR